MQLLRERLTPKAALDPKLPPISRAGYDESLIFGFLGEPLDSYNKLPFSWVRLSGSVFLENK